MTIAHAVKKTKEWIDDEGRFIFGKHKGKFVDGISDTHPDYITWILERVYDMDTGDREIFLGLARQKGIKHGELGCHRKNVNGDTSADPGTHVEAADGDR